MRLATLVLMAGVAFGGATEDLAEAVLANRVDAAAKLIQAGADVNAANRYGITPLWLAATNGSAEMARLLLQAGADAKAAMPHGETALMAAARTGEPETVKVLLAAGADPNAFETSSGETALMWAAAENHGEAIRLLIAGGANPNQHAKALELAPMDWMQVGMVSTILPRGGFTAAMYAARQDAKDAIRALAESGANLDERDPDGATALQFAIINQHYDAAGLLLEKGANPNVADNTGMTGLYAAVDMNMFRSDIGRPARLLLDKLTALDVVKLALAHGANPNAQQVKAIIGRHHGFGDNQLGKGATALMRAAKGTDLEAMQVLLDAGADPMLGTANGANALSLIVTARVGPQPGAADRAIEALRMLAKHGANLNAANAKGDTPLHLVAKQGSVAMVRALCELGADVKATDAAGKTPVEVVPEGRPTSAETVGVLKEFAGQALN